ncbi:MAG: hypothetical protein K0B15_14780 [Lentimicrobium sp.]|nr:hypothetical protein [Lentimicrobium sp.]
MLNQPQFKSFQKSLSVIFFALLSGQVLFALVSLALRSSGFDLVHPEIRTWGFIIIPILVFSGFIASRFLSARLLEKARISEDMEEKYDHYKTALIIRLGLLETPSFFAIVAFLLTGERLFLGFVGMILFYFITLFPSDTRIISELNAGEEDWKGR